MLYNSDIRKLGTEKATQGYFCDDDYAEICCDLDLRDDVKTLDNYIFQLFGWDGEYRNPKLVAEVSRRLKEDYTLYICKFDCDNYITYNWINKLDYCKEIYCKEHVVAEGV